MSKPMLQIALDNLSVADAVAAAKKVEDYIDVVEVGTILLAAEGKSAIKVIKDNFKNKIVVADGKIADAGLVFSKMFFESGADFTTIICAAENSTIKQVLENAKNYNNKDVQIEMTSHFSWDQVEDWRKMGVNQVVWHRSRDAQSDGQKWDAKNIEAIKKLAAYGFKVTVTGGIEKEDIKLFKDIPIYIFIAGRSIRDAADPKLAAKELKDEIAKYWS
ncbi:MAG: 3-keto-L-gulonate-6-phosphate decarboxylase UlaD [Malacoplasma sp.]|nr:3-keto-L-gulonate-6-phosphate decarboxylase UlaD [Malacoplasma sp.]